MTAQPGFSPTHRALRWDHGTVLAPCELIRKERRNQHTAFYYVVRFEDGTVETVCRDYLMEGI